MGGSGFEVGTCKLWEGDTPESVMGYRSSGGGEAEASSGGGDRRNNYLACPLPGVRPGANQGPIRQAWSRKPTLPACLAPPTHPQSTSR